MAYFLFRSCLRSRREARPPLRRREGQEGHVGQAEKEMSAKAEKISKAKKVTSAKAEKVTSAKADPRQKDLSTPHTTSGP